MPLIAPEQFFAFLGAAVLITLSPGPDNLLVLSLGIARGRQAGVAFGLGCGLGCLSHTLLAALGVSALIAASPMAFTALKLIGGGYLVYLGVQALRSSGRLDAPEAASAQETNLCLFARGLFANAINPKVVLFFLAFLPQFVDATRGDAAWQIVQLGLVFTVQAALLFALLGLFSGHVGAWLKRHGRAGLWLDRIAGTVFVGLGIKLAAGN